MVSARARGDEASYVPGEQEMNPVKGMFGRWLRGGRVLQGGGEGFGPHEVIITRLKVHPLLYRAGLDDNEPLVRLPTLLTGLIGAVLFRRAMTGGD